MLTAVFALGTINAWKNADKMRERVRPVTDPVVRAGQKLGLPVPEDPATLVRINAGVQGVAAAALATGRFPRTAATILVASMVPTTVAGHAFWKSETPEERKAQMLQFAKNLSITGGLILAAVDTEAKPGLAWRARAATRQARREARHLAHSARQEARVAKASLT